MNNLLLWILHFRPSLSLKSHSGCVFSMFLWHSSNDEGHILGRWRSKLHFWGFCWESGVKFMPKLPQARIKLHADSECCMGSHSSVSTPVPLNLVELVLRARGKLNNKTTGNAFQKAKMWSENRVKFKLLLPILFLKKKKDLTALCPLWLTGTCCDLKITLMSLKRKTVRLGKSQAKGQFSGVNCCLSHACNSFTTESKKSQLGGIRAQFQVSYEHFQFRLE